MAQTPFSKNTYDTWITSAETSPVQLQARFQFVRKMEKSRKRAIMANVLAIVFLCAALVLTSLKLPVGYVAVGLALLATYITKTIHRCPNCEWKLGPYSSHYCPACQLPLDAQSISMPAFLILKRKNREREQSVPGKILDKGSRYGKRYFWISGLVMLALSTIVTTFGLDFPWPVNFIFSLFVSVLFLFGLDSLIHSLKSFSQLFDLFKNLRCPSCQSLTNAGRGSYCSNCGHDFGEKVMA